MSELSENIRRNISSLCVVSSGNTVEHGNYGASERISGNPHHCRITDKVYEKSASFGCMRYAAVKDELTEKKNDYEAEHSKGLDRKTANGTAAKSDLDGFSDRQGFPCLV